MNKKFWLIQTEKPLILIFNGVMRFLRHYLIANKNVIISN